MPATSSALRRGVLLFEPPAPFGFLANEPGGALLEFDRGMNRSIAANRHRPPPANTVYDVMLTDRQRDWEAKADVS